MALTVTWNEYNGAGETQTLDINDLAFGSADQADLVPANNKIVAGTNSFSKYIKLNFDDLASESISAIENLRIYKSAGAYKTGEALKFDGTSVTYATPSQSATGDADIPTSEPANNVDLGGSPSGSLTADGESGYMRFQRQTTIATEPGALNSLTITALFDVS